MSLALDLAAALDPTHLMVRAGLEPDAWQATLLRDLPSRALLLCTRQAGKSTVTAAAALYSALYGEPGGLVLILAPTQRQSAELARKVRGLVDVLPEQSLVAQQSALSIEFTNGSRIVALPGTESTIRGYSSASLLIIDEAAFVPDDHYASVRPMLAVSGGRLIALSTPRGKRGWFYNEWVNGAENWHRVRVTAEECPRISADFLAAERASLGEWRYQQEYMCHFVDSVDGLFRLDDIAAAVDDSIEVLFGGRNPLA